MQQTCSVVNPDPETDLGMQQIRQNRGKFAQKSTIIIRMSYIFSLKNIKRMFNGNKYLPNNKTDNFFGETYF